MRSLARLVVISTVLVACNSTPSNPPSSPAAGTGGPVPTAAGPGATSAPLATDAGPAAAPPTSIAKIDDALASGAIDEPTSLLYRFYASVNDDRLPAEYQGEWAEDDDAAIRVRQLWPSLTADQQAALLPFMVRPTSSKSVWAAKSSASIKANVQLASVRFAAATCQDGFLRKQVSPTIPVLVWGQCGGMTEPQVEALVDEVRQDMTDLWTPMTNFMGKPIGDENDPLAGVLESPEGGDGLLDIYLVDAALELHGRGLTTGALATTYMWPPAFGAAGAEVTSTYIVIDPMSVSGIELKSTVAHEFFHSLQAAHNAVGTHYRLGAGQPNGKFWFVEASAKWAEHEFVPQVHARLTKAWFTDFFQASGAGLAYVGATNDYASFAWPLFMQQELGRDSIAHAWSAFEGLQGYDQLTDALDGILSFKGRFRDFAVRVWNQDLEPGNPIDPRFKALANDFPDSQPSQWRLSDHNGVGVGGTFSAALSMPNLWSKYWVIEPATDVKSLTFDFTTMAPSDYVDVDLLLKIDGTWQRRAGTFSGEDKVCNVQQAIVVIANHETAMDHWAGGAWSVSGDANSCTAKGSWSVTLTGPAPGAGTYSGTGDVMCSAAPIGPGGLKWTATGIMLSNDISQLSLQQSDTFDSIGVQTPGGIEGGLWSVNGNTPSATVVVSGSGDATSGAHVSGHATWTDMAGNHFTADVSVDCAEVYTTS